MKRILLTGSTAIMTLWTASAWAQDAAPQAETSGTLGEIVVTAQRRTENLQKVPVAASALDASDLKANAVVRLNSCAGRRARSSAATRPAARSSSIRAILM